MRQAGRFIGGRSGNPVPRGVFRTAGMLGLLVVGAGLLGLCASVSAAEKGKKTKNPLPPEEGLSPKEYRKRVEEKLKKQREQALELLKEEEKRRRKSKGKGRPPLLIPNNKGTVTVRFPRGKKGDDSASGLTVLNPSGETPTVVVPSKRKGRDKGDHAWRPIVYSRFGRERILLSPARRKKSFWDVVLRRRGRAVSQWSRETPQDKRQGKNKGELRFSAGKAERLASGSGKLGGGVVGGVGGEAKEAKTRKDGKETTQFPAMGEMLKRVKAEMKLSRRRSYRELYGDEIPGGKKGQADFIRPPEPDELRAATEPALGKAGTSKTGKARRPAASPAFVLTGTAAAEKRAREESSPEGRRKAAERSARLWREIKRYWDENYHQALTGRDPLARRAAFQWGALTRRRDLLPYLLRELKEKGPWEEEAAKYLAYVGPYNEKAATKALLKGLKGKNVKLRGACAWALGRLRSKKAVKPLMRALEKEKSVLNRAFYCEALGWCGGEKAVKTLREVLQRRGPKGELEMVRSAAATALAALGDAAGRSYLVSLLDSPSPASQLVGLRGLLQLGGPRTAGRLKAALLSRYPEVWTAAVRLFPLGGVEVEPLLREMLLSPVAEIRRRAALASAACGLEDGRPLLARILRWGSPRMRLMAAEVMAATPPGDPDLAPVENAALLEALRTGDRQLRVAAAAVLTRRKVKSALPLLLKAARGESERVAGSIGSKVGTAAFWASRAENARERAFYFACVRLLRGERDDLTLASLPHRHDTQWPEFDRLVAERRAELLKGWTLKAVVKAGGRPVGAVLRSPTNGEEHLYLIGEVPAAGFTLRRLRTGSEENGRFMSPDRLKPEQLPAAILEDTRTRLTLYLENKLPPDMCPLDSKKRRKK